MSEDAHSGGGGLSPMQFLFLMLAALFALAWVQGGITRSGMRGLFINPLAPLGNGKAYGPELMPSIPTPAVPSAPEESTTTDSTTN